ncbi:hypothetical protein [Paenibacillus soyae]|uniref:Uncharacterized protein n=1 Tax=Paenibacillus soyae TaxID=2969249 RepID=A0A9X2MK35_9BACL|nr:hypothetical protein [Paenibacillus soyae]MCR2803338.1 hypothetical protein [Paenibacillus soyae]
MYKLVLYVAMMAIWLSAHTLQIEEEMAMKALFQGKRAVNRAAHAAAQQVDKTALADGIARIDASAASDAAALYLQRNLQLDENGEPLARSFLRERVDILVFEVINDDREFPFFYRNEDYDFEAVLKQPGVVLIVRMAHPRRFSVMEPISWEIKGTAELVVG